MVSKQEFLTRVRDEAKFYLENKKITSTIDLIGQAIWVLVGVVALSLVGKFLSQLYDFAIIFPCLGGVLLLCFIKKVVSQKKCVFGLKRGLIELSLQAFGLQRVNRVFKKDFLEKSKIMPEKYHFDFEFKGLGGTKEFYGASVLTGKKDSKRRNLLLAIPYSTAHNHILIYNQNWMLKFLVAGYEKIEAFFSHKMFDENMIFAQNKELTSTVLNEAFANRLEQLKQALATKIIQKQENETGDLSPKEIIPPRIDLAFFEGQLLIYIYDYALYFDPFDMQEEQTTIAQNFANLYERFKQLNDAIEILTH